MHGGPRYSPASLLCFSSWRTARWQAAEAPLEPPLLHYTSTPAGAGASLPMLHPPAVTFLLHTVACLCLPGSCHIRPVSAGPWEIHTEPPVWGEAVKWAGDMLPNALRFGVCLWMYVCMFVCMLPVETWVKTLNFCIEDINRKWKIFIDWFFFSP